MCHIIRHSPRATTQVKTLFFDTETTGLAHHNLAPTHEKQPMLIQLGMKLDGHDRAERLKCNVMVQPDGWTMSRGAKDATGLSDELADEYGVQLITAVELFLDAVYMADVIVAHNASYDITVMQRNVFVYSQLTKQDYVDPFEGKALHCSMLYATPIVRALPLKYGKYKWPTLTQCMRFFFNEDHAMAHDALADVVACSRIYYEMIDQGLIKVTE